MASDRLFSRALKVAMLLWLVGWIVKIRFFVWFLGGICLRYPLDFDFFPAWAANPWVSLCAYLLPLSACVVAILSRSARVWQSAAVIMTLGSATLCFHQNTYNDATFITSMW
ncbi:MAG: hypothetical protein OES79_04025 [Planctomycetota bacterium]|nr:hypothetical protein [Planctomycetota bacterium]